MNFKRATIALAAAITVGSLAYADILIGQTTAVTGPPAASVKDTIIGAKMVFDEVNKNGGINGQKIELITLDDAFDPKKAAANAEELITKKNVAALFLNRGTPHTEAILPLLDKHKIALVAPSTGAMILHKPVNPYVFNVRSSYQREAQMAVIHLHTIGLSRISIVHVDDSFGADGAQGAINGFNDVKLKPMSITKVDRLKPEYDKVVPQIVKDDAQAVIWIGTAPAVAGGVKALRAAGSRAQVITLSNNAAKGFIKELGDFSRGVIVSQVLPYEKSYKYQFIKDAISIAKEKGLPPPSPSVLEGFTAAKVMVEGLRKAAPNFTRERIIAGLNSIHHYDIGGLEISFSEADHTGLNFSDLAIISVAGDFQR